MPQEKIVVGKQEKAKKIVLKKLAEYVADGSVVLGDSDEWKKSQRYWSILSQVKILDLVNEVANLMKSSEEDTENPVIEEKDKNPEFSEESTEDSTQESTNTNRGNNERRVRKMSTKPEKLSEEQTTAAATSIRNLEGFQNAGDKMSKRDIASALEVSEDVANAGLQMLKTEGVVKSNRGRNAKWERLQ